MAQALPIALAVAGPLISGVGGIIGANENAKQLSYQADQLDRNAGNTRASSQRSSIDQRHKTDLASSRALALAAASGGGASDPTVVNNIAAIDGEGEFRALSALYDGDQEALGMEDKGKALRAEASNGKKAAWFNAAGSILKAGSTLYDKYG